jgi:hypothetical protein
MVSVFKTLSTPTMANDIEIAVRTISIGINQKLVFRDSQTLMSLVFIDKPSLKFLLFSLCAHDRTG